MNWSYYFNYDPESGALTWRVQVGAHGVPGKEVGGYDAHGYRKVKLHGKMYKVHRICWDIGHPDDLLREGELIDHINHKRDDNRLCNLRKATYSSNRRNIDPKYKRNNVGSGLYGVFWAESQKRWVAVMNQTRLYQGPNFFEACCRRRSAENSTNS